MKCKVIGITGGVATGKSAVYSKLKKHAGISLSADEIAHKIIAPKKQAYKRIIRIFGNKILNKDLKINRKKLGNIIFKDRALRKKLEKITHPEIISEMKRIIKAGKKRCKYIVFEAPLLFEAKVQNLAGIILVVASKRQNQISRMLKKGYSLAEAKRRIASQIPLKEKIKRADIVIYNNKSRLNLNKRIKDFVEYLKKGG